MSKRCLFSTFVILVLVLAIGITIARAGSFWGNKRGDVIQNLKELSPDVAKSRCDSGTYTKGIFKTYTTAGWYAVEMDAVDNTGAAVKGKWFLNGKQVGVGASPFKVSNRGGTDNATLAFGGYSAAPRTVDFCIRRQ